MYELEGMGELRCGFLAEVCVVGGAICVAEKPGESGVKTYSRFYVPVRCDARIGIECLESRKEEPVNFRSLALMLGSHRSRNYQMSPNVVRLLATIA